MKNFLLVLLICALFVSVGYHGLRNKHFELAVHPTHADYVEVDHGRLFYQRFGAGKPIVVLHGGPGLDQGYLLPQMLELAKDHELIFYDQRGSGKSLDGPLDVNYINIDKFVADLEQLRVALGLKDIVLLGHSWGARLAVHYAFAHPDKVSQLILMTPSPLDAEGWQIFEQEFNKKIEPIKAEIKPLFSYATLEKMDETSKHASLKRMAIMDAQAWS